MSYARKTVAGHNIEVNRVGCQVKFLVDGEVWSGYSWLFDSELEAIKYATEVFLSTNIEEIITKHNGIPEGEGMGRNEETRKQG